MYNKPNEFYVHKRCIKNNDFNVQQKMYNKPNYFNVNKRCIINPMSSMYNKQCI